jgi:hypothetical protein
MANQKIWIISMCASTSAMFSSPDSVRLEWVTEFLDPPTPRKRTRTLKDDSNLVDEIVLDFGDVWLPAGRAFLWDGSTASDTNTPAKIRLATPGPASDTNQVVVVQTLGADRGRAHRVGRERELDGYCAQIGIAAAAGRVASASDLKNRVAKGRQLPKTRVVERKQTTRAMRVASRGYAPSKGYVWDYIIVSGSGNYTFNSSTTYYLHNGGYFSGTVTLQPGCVLKFNGTSLFTSGAIVCNGSWGNFSILTSKDDDFYGEKIDGSTGTPTCSSDPIQLYYLSNGAQINGVQIRWACTGVEFDPNSNNATHWFQNSRLEQCNRGVYANSSTVYIVGATYCGVSVPTYGDGTYSFVGRPNNDCSGDIDSDGDWLLDSWEIQYFGNITSQNGSGDPDGDGLGNLQEYQMGTNPVGVHDCPRPLYEAVIRGQNPDRWFLLNNSLSDDSGSVTLGFLGGGFENDVFVNANSARYFSASTDRLTLNETDDPLGGGVGDAVPTGSFTLLFRALGAQAAGTRDHYLLSQGDLTQESGNAIAVYFAASGDLKLRVGSAVEQVVLNHYDPADGVANDVAYGAWYYLAATCDEQASDTDKQVHWYLGRVASDTLNFGSFNLVTPKKFGNNGVITVGNDVSESTGHDLAYSNPGRGYIDEVAFWRRELSSTEVNAQFNRLNALLQGPSLVFDLTRWNLLLPVDNLNQLDNTHLPLEISTGWLKSGFKYIDPINNNCMKKYFYRDGNTMVFEAPFNGADQDTGSPSLRLGSPRSELRETYADGSDHNWKPLDDTHTPPYGTHILAASCRVISGISKVIIGQIHAYTPVPQNESTGVPAIVLSYVPSTRVLTVTVKHSPTNPNDDTAYDFDTPVPEGYRTVCGGQFHDRGQQNIAVSSPRANWEYCQICGSFQRQCFHRVLRRNRLPIRRAARHRPQLADHLDHRHNQPAYSRAGRLLHFHRHQRAAGCGLLPRAGGAVNALNRKADPVNRHRESDVLQSLGHTMSRANHHRVAVFATFLIGTVLLGPSTTKLYAAVFSDDNWTGMGEYAGANGPVYATVVDGSGNLFIGGAFNVIGVSPHF